MPLKRTKGLKPGKPLKPGKFRPKLSTTRKRKSAKDSPGSKRWRNKADSAWSKVIRLPGKCELCGADVHLQAHHLISRRAVHYRHEVQNGICLCPQCHQYNMTCSAHAAPWGFEAAVRDRYPDKWAWWLEHRHKLVIGQRVDYRAKCEELTQLLENQR